MMPINYDVEYSKLQRKYAEALQRIEELVGMHNFCNKSLTIQVKRACKAEQRIEELEIDINGYVEANTELLAQVQELKDAPIKINVKSNDVWITFDAGEGRQAMLCLNNIVKDMHKEGISRGICLDAIRAALQENEL